MKTIMLVVEERECDQKRDASDRMYPHHIEPERPRRKLEVELTEAQWAIAKQAIFGAFCDVAIPREESLDEYIRRLSERHGCAVDSDGKGRPT